MKNKKNLVYIICCGTVKKLLKVNTSGVLW